LPTELLTLILEHLYRVDGEADFEDDAGAPDFKSTKAMYHVCRQVRAVTLRIFTVWSLPKMRRRCAKHWNIIKHVRI
jgi:hypothetical protein